MVVMLCGLEKDGKGGVCGRLWTEVLSGGVRGSLRGCERFPEIEAVRVHFRRFLWNQRKVERGFRVLFLRILRHCRGRG